MAGGRRAAPGGYVLDPLLLPRIEQYAHNNNIDNIDNTVEYLRRSYREYQRKQLQPFRRSVQQAVRVVKQRMRENYELDEEEEEEVEPSTSRRQRRRIEDGLESREEEHLRRRGYVQTNDSEMTTSDSNSEDAGAEKSTKENSAVVVSGSKTSVSESSDSSRPALVIQSPTFNGTSVFGNLQVEQEKPQRRPEDEPSKPAFAAPNVVAAAAAREAKTKKSAEVPNGKGSKADAKTLRKMTKKRRRGSQTEDSDKKDRAVSEAKTNQNMRFKDLGGLGEVINDVAHFMYPVLHPHLVRRLGYEHIKALLLHGPPGCGKTMLAEAIANEAGVPFFKIAAPEVVSGTSGESEAKLRTLFSEASRVAPSILFIDEIDSISSKRESAQREMERRIVTQLMICMDDLGGTGADGDEDDRPQAVLVIGATNRPDALDQALRRRFEREVCLGVPDEKARLQILKVVTSKLKLEGGFDFKDIARRTPGFVGADLKTLTKEAGCAAIARLIKTRSSSSSPVTDENREEIPWWKVEWTTTELDNVSIMMQDFETAIQKVQPSTKREGFTEIPNVTWDDVGSLDSVREELDFLICNRVKNPDDYETLRLKDSGFLLYGPPGCGKTLVAKAVAHTAGANFIYIKAGELFNKYVGETERAVRQLFSRARACAPCLIFFDEVDALAPGRGHEANAATDRVVNQLLVEMDGLEQRNGVFLIAATNRPNMIDPALLRPGRLGKRIYIPLPDAPGRTSILKALLRRLPLAADVDIPAIAQHEGCNNFTGADLHGLVQEASIIALREKWQLNDSASSASSIMLTQKHFLDALPRVQPSVSAKDYEAFSLSGTSNKRTQEGKGIRLVAHYPGAV